MVKEVVLVRTGYMTTGKGEERLNIMWLQQEQGNLPGKGEERLLPLSQVAWTITCRVQRGARVWRDSARSPLWACARSTRISEYPSYLQTSVVRQ